MPTITIPINYNQRRAIEAYCIENISERKFHIHNQIGGVGWAIKHNPKYSLDYTGNWVLECSEQHAVIIRLKFGSV